MARGAKGSDERPAGSVGSEEADALVDAARLGDQDAFAALFRLTMPIVFSNLIARSGDRALAEDLTSDAYFRAMKSLTTFEGGSRDFVSWILRIGRNLFLDHVKSGRMKWEMVMDEMPVRTSGSNPEAEAIASIEGDDLREAIKGLTEEQQEVLLLRFLQGLPIADVAKIMDRNEGAIKALQFRALKSLAKILTEAE